MNASRLRTWLASTYLTIHLRIWRWLNPARQSWVPRSLWWKLRPELHVYAHTNPSFTQTNFRFRTVNPTTAAANAAFDGADPAINTNTTLDVTAGNVPFRVRIEVDETAGGSTNITWHMRYSVNGGAYNQLTSLTTDVTIVDNTTYADDTATTNLISGSSRTFLAGYADDAAGVMPNSGNQAWTGNQHTELDVCAQLVSANLADGDTIDFRIYDSAGTALTAYTNTPRITVQKTAGAALLKVENESLSASEAHLITRDRTKVHNEAESASESHIKIVTPFTWDIIKVVTE